MHYNSIIELAYTKGIQRMYALSYSMVHCNFLSLGQSLMPTSNIDNFLIPCFCRKFFEDSHPTISENILNYTNKEHLRSIATSFLGAASASRVVLPHVPEQSLDSLRCRFQVETFCLLGFFI